MPNLNLVASRTVGERVVVYEVPIESARNQCVIWLDESSSGEEWRWEWKRDGADFQGTTESYDSPEAALVAIQEIYNTLYV